MTTTDVKDLFTRYMQIENEIRLLHDDRKDILADFKDRVAPKAFQAALASAKRKAKLKPHESDEYDQVLMLLESELAIEHID